MIAVQAHTPSIDVDEYVIVWLLSESIIDPDHVFCMQIVIRMTDFDTLILIITIAMFWPY